MNRSPNPIASDPSGLSSLPVIRAAESHEDRERIFRFRYQVYVEEMHRLQKYADHPRRLIEETAQRYPDAEQSIRDGLERFLAIYPLPAWDTAYRRSLRNLRVAQAA